MEAKISSSHNKENTHIYIYVQRHLDDLASCDSLFGDDDQDDDGDTSTTCQCRRGGAQCVVQVVLTQKFDSTKQILFIRYI